MFKADGTAIKNPVAYAKTIEKKGYTDPLFTEDGKEIRDPVAFARKLRGGSEAAGQNPEASGRKRKRGAGAPSGHPSGDSIGFSSPLMFKADGVPIKNPGRYVANIEKNGYSEMLFTADGKEIKNPSAFLAAADRRAAGEQAQTNAMNNTSRGKSGKAAGKGGGGGAALMALPPSAPSSVLFQANGTAIKNPRGYVAGIERNGYTNLLYTADGKEVRNPVAFVASLERRAEVAAEPPAKRRRRNSSNGSNAEVAGAGPASIPGVLFKADGTMIQRPAAFLASMKQKGIEEPLFTAEGEEIRNPDKFVAALEKKMEKMATEVAPVSSEGLLFKEDGTPIKKPEAYVANIESRGYTVPLFTADGTEVRNPAKFLEAQLRRSQGGTEVKSRKAVDSKRSKGTVASAAPKKRKARKRSEGPEGPQPSERPEGLYKANGKRIRNVEGYVAGIEANGYTQPLFTAAGVEIRNPVAYAAKLLEKQSAMEQVAEYQPEERPPEGLYKATGERIRNAEAYVAKHEADGFTEQLFNARGQEIRNPAAYVARMKANELKNQDPMKPTRTAVGKASYYGKIGRGSLTSSLVRGARNAAKRGNAKSGQKVIGRRPAPSSAPDLVP